MVDVPNLPVIFPTHLGAELRLDVQLEGLDGAANHGLQRPRSAIRLQNLVYSTSDNPSQPKVVILRKRPVVGVLIIAVSLPVFDSPSHCVLTLLDWIQLSPLPVIISGILALFFIHVGHHYDIYVFPVKR